jgi:CHAT domain-containing protein/Tol biopolymer transport system component/Tfp pilus assembly protein PilF
MLLRRLIFLLLTIALPIFYFVTTVPAFASSKVNLPVQITTHPGEDFAPTLSADGKRMVFVSDRSGNLDLWMKRRGQGIQPLDEQLTYHSAEDNSPKLSPSGKQVAFISHRSDPKGDIYLLDLEVGKTEEIRLTQADLPEEDPEWSPDEKVLYFTSIDPESRERGIFKIELKTKSKSLVIENAVNPAVSPDGKYLAYISGDGIRDLWVQDLKTGSRIQMTSGSPIEVTPSWSKNGEHIYFTRYKEDTNFDGELTINDNPSIWRVEWVAGKPGKLRQLTDSRSYDLFPASSVAGKLIFTSTQQNSIDVWEVPGDGLLPTASGYGNTLQIVDDLCSGPEGYSYLCLLGYTNLIEEFDGEKSLARTRYRLALGYKKRGHLDTAYRLFEEIIKKHPDEKTYRGLSEIDLLLLKLDRSRDEGQTIYKENINAGLGLLQKIANRYPDSTAIGARAFFEMGNLHFQLDHQSRALEFYKKVINQYPSQRYLSAGAAFSQNKIYSLVGDQDRLVQTYVQVVQDYNDVDFWTDKAVDEILKIYEKHPTLEKKVSSLQALTSQYKNLPRLAGAVQNRIGELFHNANENLLAKEAYKKTIDQFPQAVSEVFNARVALANIYSEEENFEKSLALYEEVSADSDALADHLEKAKQGWIRKMVEKGTWELRVGEVKLASKTFRKLIDFSPDSVEAHRGYLQASAVLKKTDKSIQFYHDRLKERKDSAVDHYALGLAFTYLSPPDLAQAEKAISQALAIDSQQVFFHQTLGWIYEQKERLAKGEADLERAVSEYQMALALNDEKLDPENEANLALNLGNGHYLLNNHFSAYHYYRKRKSSGVPFFDSQRASIFHQRFGESAFKSGFHDESLAQYQKALKVVSEKKDLNRMAELNDRIALVFQDKGDHAKAVEFFSKTLELNQEAGNQVSLSRSLRNIANNLFMLNQEQAKPDTESMNQALNNYFQAIDSLEKHGVVERAKKKEKEGLIGIKVETGVGEDVSAAATGFDRVGEQKLIFHYIGKIYGDFKEYDKAIEYFKKKLALIPEDLDVEKNIPIILEKALLQNQIGNFLFHEGQYEESLEYFNASYQLSRKLNNKRGIAVNAANIGRAVFTKCQYQPLVPLREEIKTTIQLLKEASNEMGPIETFPSPEYILLAKNYLGIFNHYLGFYFPAQPAEKETSDKSPDALKSLVLASTSELRQGYDYVKKSRSYFEEGLALHSKSKKSFPELEAVLQQNLALTTRLAGKEKDKKTEETEKVPPLHLKWQYKYIESLVAEPAQRLPLLLEAEQLLAALPYGVLANDFSTLAMVEDLYLALTRLLYDEKKFAEALVFSEKGRQQLLVALRPELEFVDEDRRNYYDELISYADRFLTASSLEMEGKGDEAEQGTAEIIEEYGEVLGALQEENPSLAALFSPYVPSIEETQDQIRAGETLLIYQLVFDRLLVWKINSESVQVRRIAVNAELSQHIMRLGREGAKPVAADLELLAKSLIAPVKEVIQKSQSLTILADGALEFLPWAALPVDGKTLIETVPLTFVSSLAQHHFAESQKNLYNSRILGVDAAGFDKMSAGFASAVNLKEDQALLDRFRSQWTHYGVVHIDSRTHLGRLDPSDAFITIGGRQNHFQRVELAELFVQPLESNLIALNNVEPEFHPELRLSPTAPLIQALTAKGYPGVLLRSGAFDPALHAEMMEVFYKTFRQGKPAESLRQAQMEMIKRHPGSLAWTGYRFYGFAGMEEAEKQEFAKTHFMDNAKNGAQAFTDKDWLGTIDHLEKALALVDFLEDKSLVERIIKTLAQAAYNLEDYPKAIGYQENLVARARQKEDPEERAEALYFLGILHSRAENYPTAVGHLREALAIYEEYEILDRLAENYSTLGIVEENALDFDKALEAFTASLALNEEIGEDLNRGRELRRIGRIYYLRLNQYAQAKKYFQQAYKLFEELEHNEQKVETLLELGLVAEKQGDFTPALDFYQKAQALATAEDLQAGLSKALLYQANSHWFQGNYQKAFRFQKESLEIAEAIKDKRQQTFIFNTLGLIYWTLNDSKRALENLNRSLNLAVEVQSPLDVASANNNIGLVYRKDKNYEKSIEFFNKALEKDIELKSKWGQGYTHRNLGMSFMRMKKLDEAETHIAQAIDLSREIGNQTNLVKSMLESGHLALEKNQCEKAIPVFQETGQLAEKLNIPEVNWRALRGEGVCLAKDGRNGDAAEQYKKAVAVVDGMRAAIKVEEFQNGFLTDKQDVYKELILILLNLGQVEESFNYAERAKSRSFIDLLGNQRISLKNDVSQKLYNQLTDQKQKIRSIEDALGVARSGPDEEVIKEIAANLVKARSRYQDLLIQAKEESPEISNFVTVESITLKELEKLLEPQVALVEYLVTENELVAWVIRQGGIEVVRTPVKEADLSELIADYRKRMQQLAPLDDQTAQLYNWLIRPIDPLIDEKRVLGIIPHSHLHYISFSSLRDGESYLMEKHPLFFSPSASVLKFTFARKKAKKESGAVKVLALGNPDLGDLNYDLPLAEMEANAIKWDFPEIEVLTRDKATESWLTEHIEEYQIIHIASHGEFDPVNPLFSSLKLTKDTAEDGNFEVNEVFSLNINADIVTLSACQTGLGKITGGDELVGLNRAFIYAGTHSLLSSLWRVSDISTAILIKHFYRNYSQETKAESLRKAQLLVKRLYPHPSYWAGFNLTGDYR